MSAISLGNVFHASLRALLGNRCFTKIVAAIGGTAAKVRSTATAEFCIDGVMYSKASTDDLFVHTDVTVQAVSTTKYYALCLDATGAGSIIPGTATELPDIPSNVCLVGAIKVVTGAANTFTPATTAHNAAGVTTTYFNLSCAPAGTF